MKISWDKNTNTFLSNSCEGGKISDPKCLTWNFDQKLSIKDVRSIWPSISYQNLLTNIFYQIILNKMFDLEFYPKHWVATAYFELSGAFLKKIIGLLFERYWKWSRLKKDLLATGRTDALFITINHNSSHKLKKNCEFLTTLLLWHQQHLVLSPFSNEWECVDLLSLWAFSSHALFLP